MEFEDRLSDLPCSWLSCSLMFKPGFKLCGRCKDVYWSLESS